MSAAKRVVIWRSTLEMIKDHPFGVGFYHSESVIGNYPDPKTGISNPERATHNTFLRVAAEIGIQGFIVYFIIFSQTFFSMAKIRRSVKQYGLDMRLFEYATMFQAALVGYFVAACFVDVIFIDLPWHLVGLCIALDRIANKERTLRPMSMQEAL